MELRAKNKLITTIIWILFILYLALLVKVILFKYSMITTLGMINYANKMPIDYRISRANFIPFKTLIHYLGCIKSSGVAKVNILANIVAFAPMGFLMPILLKKLQNGINVSIVSFIVSLLFELTQLILSIGEFDIDDIILNVLGAILGYLLFKVFSHLASKILKVNIAS
jgi:glycopeptide antibiotics resistance protein